MKNGRRYVSLLVALALLGLSVAVATAATRGKHKFKGHVNVAIVADLTGTFAPYSNVQGMLAYIHRVNAKGGVDGYKVVAKEYDAGSDPAKALQAFRRALAGKPAGMLTATFMATVALPTVAQSGIPAVGDGFAPGWTGHSSLFSVDGDVSTHLSDIYFVDLKKFAGATKIALIGSPLLKGDLENLARPAQYNRAGVQIVMQNFGLAGVLNSADALTLAQQIKASGATGVVDIGQAGVPQLQTALNQLGAHVTVQTTEFGPASKAQEGLLYATQWATRYMTNVPGVRQYIKAMKQLGYRGVKLDQFPFGTFRYAQARLLIQKGLMEAGPPFSAKRVVRSLNHVKHFTAGGLVPKAGFPRFHKVGVNCHSAMQIVNGKWKVLTKGKYPFVCGGPSYPNPGT